MPTRWPDNVLIAGAKIGLGRSLTRLGRASQAIPHLEQPSGIAGKGTG
jgi:hypothetical protein